MDSRTVIKLCLGAFFAMFVIYILSHWHKWDEVVTTGADGEESVTQGSKVVYKLLSCLILAVIGGIFIVMVVLPKLGDAVGTVMYSSGEEVSADEAMKAAAKMAAGDYEGAIQHFENLIEEKPDDPYAISEIAKIHSERLDDPATAIAFLRQHLESHDWSEDNAAFLMFRIADVHLHKHQFEEAKDILEQIVGNFPGTRHSANGKHRINEIEQAQFRALQAQRGSGNTEA